MKKTLIISIITLFIGVSIQSQAPNKLSLEECGEIKINDIFFYKITNTTGDLSTMNDMFNLNFSQYTDNEVIKVVELTNLPNGLLLYYEDDEFAYFEIKNNKSNLTIKGTTITVGDDISKLGNASRRFDTIVFGNGELLYHFEIKFDRATEKIVKISFLSLQ